MISATTHLKFLAPDGKKRLADMLDYTGIIALGKEFPSKTANKGGRTQRKNENQKHPTASISYYFS